MLTPSTLPTASGFSPPSLRPCLLQPWSRGCLLLFVAALLVSCTSGDSYYNTFPKGARKEGARIRDESDKPYYADYWQRQLAEFPHPKEALREADAYFDSLPYFWRTPHRDKVRVEFLRGYFNGFVTPGEITMVGKHDACWHGVKAGQVYRRTHPAKLKETMEDFGYTAAVARGRWLSGFEISDFRPLGGGRDKSWWLSALTSTAFEFAKDVTIPHDGISLRVEGFLSPKGAFGHLNGYDHEFYATQISTWNGG